MSRRHALIVAAFSAASAMTATAMRPRPLPAFLGPLAMHAADIMPVVSIPPEGPCREIIWAAGAPDLVDAPSLVAVRNP